MFKTVAMTTCSGERECALLNNEMALLKKAIERRQGEIMDIIKLSMRYLFVKIISGEEKMEIDTQMIVRGASLVMDAEDEKQTDILLKSCSYVPSYRERIIELAFCHKGDSERSHWNAVILHDAELLAEWMGDAEQHQNPDFRQQIRTCTGKELVDEMIGQK